MVHLAVRWPRGKEESREGLHSQRRAGVATMIVGGIFLGLGVIATIVSYSMASGGGTYFVFYGAMIFGALDLVVGLVRYLNAPKQEVAEGWVRSAVDLQQVYPAGGVPSALGDSGRLSAIDSALSPSPAYVDGAVVSAAAPGRLVAQGLTAQPAQPTAAVPPLTEVAAAPSGTGALSEAAAQPAWTGSPTGGEGGQVYFDETAVTRLREQTRMYYAQQSMRAQGRCEVCGRELKRAARWRGAVRCPDHL
jgi:hypothetical protein